MWSLTGTSRLVVLTIRRVLPRSANPFQVNVPFQTSVIFLHSNSRFFCQQNIHLGHISIKTQQMSTKFMNKNGKGTFEFPLETLFGPFGTPN